MIDLFSILFSTAMVLIVIVQAIKREREADSHPENKGRVGASGALKDRANFIDKGTTR